MPRRSGATQSSKTLRSTIAPSFAKCSMSPSLSDPVSVVVMKLTPLLVIRQNAGQVPSVLASSPSHLRAGMPNAGSHLISLDEASSDLIAFQNENAVGIGS